MNDSFLYEVTGGRKHTYIGCVCVFEPSLSTLLLIFSNEYSFNNMSCVLVQGIGVVLICIVSSTVVHLWW